MQRKHVFNEFLQPFPTPVKKNWEFNDCETCNPFY